MYSVIARAALAAAVLFAAFPATATTIAASASDQIPGAPWPGSLVRGYVGANVVDIVWRLEVSAPRTAVFSLEGERGAEIGLYLFDSSAVSVIESSPIASSARVGRQQSVTLLLPVGTYYVNVNGRNVDRLYSFTLTTVLIEDRTPPSVRINFGGGRERLNAESSFFDVIAFDSLTPVSDIRYQINQEPWSDWLPYSQRFTLPQQLDGTVITVHAQARNLLGLLSVVTTGLATFDFSQPHVTLRSMDIRDGYFANSMPKLRLIYSETMITRTIIVTGPKLLTLSGGTVRTKIAYSPQTRIATLQPTQPLTAGGSYVLTYGAVLDLAGNKITEESAQIFVYKLGTRISAPKLASNGPSGVVVRVSTKGLPVRSSLILEREEVDAVGGESNWITVGSSTVRTNKRARFTIPNGAHGRYRVVYAETETRLPARSATFRWNPTN